MTSRYTTRVHAVPVKVDVFSAKAKVISDKI